MSALVITPKKISVFLLCRRQGRAALGVGLGVIAESYGRGGGLGLRRSQVGCVPLPAPRWPFPARVAVFSSSRWRLQHFCAGGWGVVLDDVAEEFRRQHLGGCLAGLGTGLGIVADSSGGRTDTVRWCAPLLQWWLVLHGEGKWAGIVDIFLPFYVICLVSSIPGHNPLHSTDHTQGSNKYLLVFMYISPDPRFGTLTDRVATCTGNFSAG